MCNMYPNEIFKVICTETNESIPDLFTTFGMAFDALKEWDKEHCIVECYRGEEVELCYSTEWEEN